MKVLLTGGAGYIGSHTAVELLAAGHEAVVADNFVNSSPDAVRRVERIAGKPVALYELDVCDRAGLAELFRRERPDAPCSIRVLARRAQARRGNPSPRSRRFPVIDLCKPRYQYNPTNNNPTENQDGGQGLVECPPRREGPRCIRAIDGMGAHHQRRRGRGLCLAGTMYPRRPARGPPYAEPS